MKSVLRLLALVLALALTIAFLAVLDGSRVHAKVNTGGHYHDSIPPEMPETKHLRPVFAGPKFYEQDPRNPAHNKKTGVTVHMPGESDRERGGPILGTEAAFKALGLRNFEVLNFRFVCAIY